MTDFMPEPTFIDVSDRVWGAIRHYLPHRDGKIQVGVTKRGIINPELAKEQIYDAMKRAKKSSGKRHLDPLMKKGFPNRMVNAAVADLIDKSTVKKGSKGRWYIVKNYFASKLGWRRRRVIRTMELPKAHPRRSHDHSLHSKRRRKRKRIV